VPHLRDSLIVAKVGIVRRSARPLSLQAKYAGCIESWLAPVMLKKITLLKDRLDGVPVLCANNRLAHRNLA